MIEKALKLTFLVFLFGSCATVEPYYNKSVADWRNNEVDEDADIKYTLYLIGDCGKANYDYQLPALSALENHLEDAKKKSGVIFLGDNIYPFGLPYPRHPRRTDAERSLDQQIEILDKYKGDIFFIPGNHDYEQGRSRGLEYLHYQEEYLEEALNEDVFVPDDGCVGPEEIDINDETVLLVYDSQWWLHYWEKTDELSDCDATDDQSFLLMMSDALERNKHRKVIVAAHHPIYTYGNHGRKFSFKQHLFPLTEGIDNLYLPLPLIGSIYPLYRSIVGDIQDIPHYRYHELRKRLTKLFNRYENITYISGHEHSLQYIPKDGQHYVVSGSGAKMNHVAKTKKAAFTYGYYGFATLDFYKDGQVWLSFIEADGSKKGNTVFRKHLYTKEEQEAEKEEITYDVDFSDSIVYVSASPQYKSNKLKDFWLGSNYRAEWRDTIAVPVFDIGSMMGGLKIVQRGGGMQTRSLRLETEDGRQYALRTIEKFVSKALPTEVQGTFAEALIQDGISAAHPYGWYTIPTMAESVGVYHTNPTYYYIPDDPRFGKHREDFRGYLCLFEERPAGNREDVASFGSPKDIESTPKVLEKIYEDNKNFVDQQAVVRARLFDILIGDWDRHDDQWRWAEFKENDLTFYQPIPRDRDQAFYHPDGVMTWLASRKFVQPKLQGFKHDIWWVRGLAYNGRWFDRSFLTEPSLDIWLAYVDTIKYNLSDEVIENAIATWPEDIYNLSGPEVIDKLKSRRDNLEKYAVSQYRFLAKAVSVAGSDKRELFDVDRIDDEHMQVTVYDLNKDGEKGRVTYHRLFRASETNEVRLFALDGDDEFEIDGDVKSSITLRIIAGDGQDILRDNSNVKGPVKKTIFYDYNNDYVTQAQRETKFITSDKPWVNEFNRKHFEFKYLGPVIFFGSNPTDGFFLGGGARLTTQKFRKDPFATDQVLKANYAFKTGAYNIVYEGLFKEALGRVDLGVAVNINAPNFVSNYFGFGNQSDFDQETFDDESEFYNIRYDLFQSKVHIAKDLGQFNNVELGLKFSSIEVLPAEDGEAKFISDFENNQLDSATLFETNNFLGAELAYKIDTRDQVFYPHRGIFFDVAASYQSNFNDDWNDFAKVRGSLSFYFTLFSKVQTTIAARIGGSANIKGSFADGDYQFFQGNFLGGTTNLRGFRRERFVGDYSMYQNTDIRIKLFKFGTIIANGDVGLLGFFDVGKVFVKNVDDDGPWHTGYGGGIWMTPYNAAVVSANFTFSDDEDGLLFFLGFGFLF